MSIVITTIEQITIMFLIAGAGMAAYRCGILDSEKNKILSDVVLKIVTPALVISSFQTDYSAEKAKGLFVSLLLGILSYAITIFFSMFLIRKTEKFDYKIARFSCSYSNCGYIGLPLAYGIYGKEGVFYMTAFTVIFNILVYSHGAYIMRKDNYRFSFKKLISPALVGVAIGMILFFCRVKLPYLIDQPMVLLADMNTPLAMLIAGAAIIQVKPDKLKKNLNILLFAFYKLLLFPVIFILLVSLFPLPDTAKMTAVIATACPSAALCIMFSLQNGRDDVYASEIFAVTTLLSIITLPCMMGIAELL